MPSLAWVPPSGSGLRPENQLAIGVGLGGVNGAGIWVTLDAVLPQSGPASYTVDAWKVDLLSPLSRLGSQSITAPAVGETITATVRLINGVVYTTMCGSFGCATDQFRQNLDFTQTLDTTTVEWFAAALNFCSTVDGQGNQVAYACNMVPSFSPFAFRTPAGSDTYPDLTGRLVRTNGPGASPLDGPTTLDLFSGRLLGPTEFGLFYRNLDSIAPSTPGTPVVGQCDAADGSFTISWSPASDSNPGIWEYEVQQQIGSGPWSVLSATIRATSYSISRPPGTYSYRVRSGDMAGNWGVFSATSAAVVPPPDTILPTSPGSPTWLIDDELDGAFILYWSAASDSSGIVGYELQEKVGSGSWITVAYPTTVSYTLQRSIGTYYYRVRAVDCAGNWGPLSSPSAALIVSSNFGVSSSCSYVSMLTGGYQRTCTITARSYFGFSGTVSLSGTVSPVVSGGPTASLSPSGVTLSANGQASATLTITSGSGTGQFVIRVRGTSGSLSHYADIQVEVKPPGSGGGSCPPTCPT